MFWTRRFGALVALQREFRPWAMWRDGTGEWTATRAEPGEARLVWGAHRDGGGAGDEDEGGGRVAYSEWLQADLTIQRLRAALAHACGAPADAITWSYGGVSGEKSATRIHIRLELPEGTRLADVVARNIELPAGDM